MRTVKIVLALVAAVVIFNSCKKEYAEPTIAWTPNALSQFVDFDDDATWNKTLNITFGAEAGISEIKIWKHVYMAGEVDPISVIISGPTGYDALTTFDYEFTTIHAATDFAGGVSKIVYEFEVTDASETPQHKSKEYSFLVDEVFTVTIEVKDEQGVAITDATVTFGNVEKTEAPYTFTFVPAGTYAYSVAKTGYTTLNVAEYTVSADATIAAELIMNISAWSENVMIALQPTYAKYHGVRVTSNESTMIGFKYTTNNNAGTAAVVVATAGCTGWVEVTTTDYTTKSELAAAYAAGTPMTTTELAFTYEGSKVFAERNFISKMGTEYYLVKYVDGVVSPADHTSTTGNFGNVLVFKYKN